jgi:hypothetical protein
MSATTTTEQSRERRRRRRLAREGMALHKSRVVTLHLDDFGGYRIINGNWVVRGARFDLGLDDVEEYRSG